MDPFNRLFSRSSSVTRPFTSVVTPYQVPIGSSLSQLSLFSQFAPSVAL